MKKKVCIALYGQPRLLEEGHRYIMNSISSYPKDEFEIDFLCHAYNYENTNLEKYECSSWSKTQHAKVEKNIEERIVSLYNPILYEIEEPFDNSKIDAYINLINLKESLMWKCSTKKDGDIFVKQSIPNHRNSYSQFNSRKQLVKLYKKLDKRYDFVVCMRYDFLRELDSDLFYNIDPFYLNVSGELTDVLLNDNCVISNPDIFLKYNSVMDNIPYLINNAEYADRCERHSSLSGYIVIAEVYLLCNLLYYYGTWNIMKRVNGIPNYRHLLAPNQYYNTETGCIIEDLKFSFKSSIANGLGVDVIRTIHLYYYCSKNNIDLYMNENDNWLISNHGNWRSLFTSMNMTTKDIPEISKEELEKVNNTPMPFDDGVHIANELYCPQEKYKKELPSMLSNKEKYAVVHVRRGDKVEGDWKEGTYHELDEYLQHLDYKNEDIFVMTDSSDVAREAKSKGCMIDENEERREGYVYNLYHDDSYTDNEMEDELHIFFKNMEIFRGATDLVGSNCSNYYVLGQLLNGKKGVSLSSNVKYNCII